MTKMNPNLVFGYAELARIFNVSPQALSMRKWRGRMELEPVFYVGRTAVYDRQQAEALAESEAQQVCEI